MRALAIKTTRLTGCARCLHHAIGCSWRHCPVLAPSWPCCRRPWPLRSNQWHRLQRARRLPDTLIARLLIPLWKGLRLPHLRARRALHHRSAQLGRGKHSKAGTWARVPRPAQCAQPARLPRQMQFLARSSADVWQPDATREMLLLLATRSSRSGDQRTCRSQ